MKKLTPKREKFCLTYLASGNACKAYRESHDAQGMSQRTIEKRAGELLKDGAVTGRLAQLRAKATGKAVLSRAWVLERLMRNAAIALGEEPIKIKIRPKGKDTDTAVELEVTDRDAAAANRALEMLGKLPEVKLFEAEAPAGDSNSPPLSPTAEWLQRVRAGNVVPFARRAGAAVTKAEAEAPAASHVEPDPAPSPAAPPWLPPATKKEEG